MNVTPLNVEPVRDAPPIIVLPLDSLEAARDALNKIEVSAALCLRILDKAPQYSDAQVLAGVRQVFASLARLLAK